MPLSEDEQRILKEIEANLNETDPRLVQEVSETTLYRHSARAIKWAVFGFVAGLALLLFTFTRVLLLGVVGFLVMLGCLLVIERNVLTRRRRGLHGRAGRPVDRLLAVAAQLVGADRPGRPYPGGGAPVLVPGPRRAPGRGLAPRRRAQPRPHPPRRALSRRIG